MDNSAHIGCTWPKCQTSSAQGCSGLCSTSYRQIAPQPPLLYDATQAAAALTEAQATIARQQVMLDRALESSCDMQITIALLEAALEFYAPKEVDGIKFAGGDDAGQRARAALSPGKGE